MKHIPEEDKQRILIWDVESAAATAYVWGLGKQVIHYGQMIDDSYILCISWKWLGEKEVHSLQLKPSEARRGKDKRILKEFSKVLSKADYYVGHNIDSFDVKMVNRGLIRNNLDPIAPTKTFDTLKLARKYFRFTSNKLDAICQDLDLGKKTEAGGFPLWVSCMNGDKSAMDLMVKYNRQDVVINEKLFEKLRPYITLQTKIAIPVVLDTVKVSGLLDKAECNNCGRVGLHINKKYVTKAGHLRLACRCPSCRQTSTIAGGKSG